MSLQPSSFPLEPSTEELRQLVEQSLARVLPFIESLPEQPAGVFEGGAELARSLAESLPEKGASMPDLLDLLFERVVPNSFNTAGPGYLAFIPGGGLPHTAVANLIGDIVNRFVTLFAAAPGMVQLEVNAVRWFCELVGLPATAGGVLTSGGSMANFMALVAARREKLPENFLKGALYVSDQVHHSVTKAAVLAGFPLACVRVVPTDHRCRMSLKDLRRMVAEDREEGLQPFMIVASGGTTNSGAIDPLTEIAEYAAEEELWMHVDAAYGGFFASTDRGRLALQGIELADSVTLDPHKGLFLPYGSGCLLVREPDLLRRAHSVTSDYMPPYQDDADLVDLCAISPELSRDNRGLRVWLPIKLLGFEPFRDALDEKLDLARHAAEQLRRMPAVSIVAEPELSLVAFRLEPEGVEGEALDELNRKWLEAVNRRARVMLTDTTLGGRRALRICVLSFRTHLDRIEMALEDLREVAKELLDPNL
ncbi:MAG: aromatic-L-amino-acid decarboxylase [Candidatus Paceibacteria bacterium]|jgi:aromatic-L-amino-acid decarboxylase